MRSRTDGCSKSSDRARDSSPSNDSQPCRMKDSRMWRTNGFIRVSRSFKKAWSTDSSSWAASISAAASLKSPLSHPATALPRSLPSHSRSAAVRSCRPSNPFSLMRCISDIVAASICSTFRRFGRSYAVKSCPARTPRCCIHSDRAGDTADEASCRCRTSRSTSSLHKDQASVLTDSRVVDDKTARHRRWCDPARLNS